jgi:hypothetical protein
MIHEVNSKGTTMPQQAWTGVDGRLWCWSAGRVSSAVKVPVALLGSLFQLGKMTIKALVLPISYAAHRFSHKAETSYEGYNGAWSLRGVAIDGITSLRLIRGAAENFINIVIAPNEESSKEGWNKLAELINGKLNGFKHMDCTQLLKKALYNPKRSE